MSHVPAENEELFMGVDFGTSVVKGCVVNSECIPIEHYSFYRENRGDTGIIHEHDANKVWWGEFRRVCRALMKKLGEGKRNIVGATVTGMVPNLLPLDKRGRPLRPAMLYYDGRAASIEDRLDAEFKTPKPMNQFLAQLIWVKKDMGEKWDEVDTVLSTHNYVAFKLTGEKYVDTITAHECGNILDAKNMEWNATLLNRFGLDASRLPPIVPPSTVVGHVSREASEETGIPEGVPVVAGSTDMISSFFSAGTRKKMEMLIYYGTYGCALMLNEQPKDVLTNQKIDYPIEWRASLPRSGQQLTYLSKAILKQGSEKKALSTLDELAAKSTPGANGVCFVQMPNLARSIESSEPSGVLFNLRNNISLSDVARAMLEAFGYGLKFRFEAFAKAQPPVRYYAAGGGAKSKVWRQIISDIVGVEQDYFYRSAPAYGSAIMAALSLKPSAWASYEGFVEENLERVYPTSERAALEAYEEGYRRYRKLVLFLKDFG